MSLRIEGFVTFVCNIMGTFGTLDLDIKLEISGKNND